jgi:RNA polymerase sigma factor (sigma-70 family)
VSLALFKTLLSAGGVYFRDRFDEVVLTSDTNNAFLTALEKTHGRQLRRYLAARLRNAAADVPDLAQEVYLRLLRIDNHETIRDTPAYLFTVASHVLHQYRLRRAAIPESIEIMDVVAELQNVADMDPAKQVELEQRFELLGRGLFQHSPRAYATLMMHRCDGIPLQEIAEQFGVSYTMAKRYLSKALTYLEQRLEGE